MVLVLGHRPWGSSGYVLSGVCRHRLNPLPSHAACPSSLRLSSSRGPPTPYPQPPRRPPARPGSALRWWGRRTAAEAASPAAAPAGHAWTADSPARPAHPLAPAPQPLPSCPLPRLHSLAGPTGRSPVRNPPQTLRTAAGRPPPPCGPGCPRLRPGWLSWLSLGTWLRRKPRWSRFCAGRCLCRLGWRRGCRGAVPTPGLARLGDERKGHGRVCRGGVFATGSLHGA